MGQKQRAKPVFAGIDKAMPGHDKTVVATIKTTKPLKFVNEFSPRRVEKVESTKSNFTLGNETHAWPCTTMRQLALQVQGKASKQADFLYCRDEAGALHKYKLPLREDM